MTPKQKAKELVANFFKITPQPYSVSEAKGLEFHDWDKDWTSNLAKQCALICVNQILKTSPIKFKLTPPNQPIQPISDKEYWQEVKQEIEKI